MNPSPDGATELSIPVIRSLATALGTVGANLPTILGSLRAAAGPDAAILVLTVYNPFSGTGTAFDAAGDLVVTQLNGIIRQVAADAVVGAAVADIEPDFQGKAPLLTHIAEANSDIHPNDAGHQAIADAFTAALKATVQEQVIKPPATVMQAHLCTHHSHTPHRGCFWPAQWLSSEHRGCGSPHESKSRYPRRAGAS